MTFEEQVINSLKKHGFKKCAAEDWVTYEAAKRQVLLDVEIKDNQEYELMICLITRHLNV